MCHQVFFWEMVRIVVVGAGVVGLTSALELLKDKSNEITIVAQQFPTDYNHSTIYTSPIAGANWHSFAPKEDKFTQEIDIVGYYKFKELSRIPESGVTSRKEKFYVTLDKFYNVYSGKKMLPWYAHGEFAKLINFRELEAGEYSRDKFAYGFEFDGFVIRTSYYMTYLINEMWRLSGSYEMTNSRFNLRRKSIKKLSDAFDLHHNGKADLVVNCTGLLARDLDDIGKIEKTKMYPVRGIVYIVENNTGMKDNTFVDIFDIEHPDERMYFMPRREGELLIGGVFEVENESQYADPGFLVRLVSRCNKYLPQFDWDNIKVIRTQVGYRPFRKGGYRIEKVGDIVHCYGMGAAGFQSSWGSANKVVGLVSGSKPIKSKF